MCYAKPGPRCSASARQSLAKATAAFHKAESDLASSDPADAEDARAALMQATRRQTKAISDYRLTDAGIQELRENNPALAARYEQMRQDLIDKSVNSQDPTHQENTGFSPYVRIDDGVASTSGLSQTATDFYTREYAVTGLVDNHLHNWQAMDGVGGLPEPSVDDTLTAYENASATYEAMRSECDQIGADLYTRMRDEGVTEFVDGSTGAHYRSTGNQTYQSWQWDSLDDAVLASDSDWGGATQDEAHHVVGEYRKVFSPGRASVTALREAGLEPKEFASRTEFKPGVHITGARSRYQTPSAAAVVATPNSWAYIREAAPGLRATNAEIPLDRAISEYGVLSTQTQQMKATVDMLDATVAARLGDAPLSRNGFTYEPRARGGSERHNVDDATRAALPAIAQRANVTPGKAAAVIATYRKFVVIDRFRKRDLAKIVTPNGAIDPSEYVTKSPVRQVLKRTAHAQQVA